MSTAENSARRNASPAGNQGAMISGDRENRVREDLTRRLKGVCGEMSSEEFEALVAKMTTEQLRGERTPPHRTRPAS